MAVVVGPDGVVRDVHQAVEVAVAGMLARHADQTEVTCPP